MGTWLVRPAPTGTRVLSDPSLSSGRRRLGGSLGRRGKSGDRGNTLAFGRPSGTGDRSVSDRDCHTHQVSTVTSVVGPDSLQPNSSRLYRRGCLRWRNG